MTPSKEAEAMREAIIAAIPGGSICDPQSICDMIRALPAIPAAVVSIPVIKEGARIDGGEPAAPASGLTDDLIATRASEYGDQEATDFYSFSRYTLTNFVRSFLPATAPVADTAQQWISVDTRLPEINQPVWLFEPDTSAWIGGRGQRGGEWCWCNANGTEFLMADGTWNAAEMNADEDYQPTHWMPLPAAPAPESTQ